MQFRRRKGDPRSTQGDDAAGLGAQYLHREAAHWGEFGLAGKEERATGFVEEGWCGLGLLVVARKLMVMVVKKGYFFESSVPLWRYNAIKTTKDPP